MMLISALAMDFKDLIKSEFYSYNVLFIVQVSVMYGLHVEFSIKMVYRKSQFLRK